MKRLQRLGAVILLLAVPAAGGHGKDQKERDMSPEETVVQANNLFALAVLERMKDREKNTFLSPVSLSTALAMVLAGAEGETASQMAAVMGLPEKEPRIHEGFAKLMERLRQSGDQGKNRLRIANALWGQKGYAFLDTYTTLVGKRYDAGISELDFIEAGDAARNTINRWVEEKTEKKIKDLIAPGMLGPMTRLVLTNAVYFKGFWETPFEKSRTRDHDFTLEGGGKVQVPMMRVKDRFRYGEEAGFKMLELPYEGNRLSMVLLLPRQPDGLGPLEKSLTPEKLKQWSADLLEEEVEVALPRFKTAFQVQLSDVLKAMGMGRAFTPGDADFSGMNGRKDLFISEVVHKAFVEVNEEGTEAAAATGAVMQLTAIMKPRVFEADHPFLFMIRDCEKGTILFLGRLMKP